MRRIYLCKRSADWWTGFGRFPSAQGTWGAGETPEAAVCALWSNVTTQHATCTPLNLLPGQAVTVKLLTNDGQEEDLVVERLSEREEREEQDYTEARALFAGALRFRL